MADWHLRDTVPVCRTDDFWKAQSRKIRFIKRLQAKHKCPILVAGDVLHTAKSSPYLEQYLLRTLPGFVAIPGQHDLIHHNIDNFEKGSIAVINTREDIVIATIKVGTIQTALITTDPPRSVGLIHTFIRNPNDKQDKEIGGESAVAILKKYPTYDLIVSGDNHKDFAVSYNGRVLVNPGSVMRSTSAQKEHSPGVYLWYKGHNGLEQVRFPNIDPDVISDKHIKKERDKDERFNAFVKSLNSNYEIGANFEKSLKNYFVKNKTREPVKNLIWEWIE